MNIHARAVVLLLAGALLLAGPVAAAQPAATVTLDQALFTDPDGTAPQVVQLPHLWRHPSSAQATARYRLRFTAPAEATDFAVYVRGTNLPFEALLNGQHAHENGGPASGPVPLMSWRAAPSFRVPVALLRPGVNELELQVYVNRPGLHALGRVSVGSAEAIAALEFRGWVVHNMLPLVVASLLGMVGLTALALWRGRRDYALFFWLGTGATLWSLHNILYQLPFAVLPQPHLRVLMIGLYGWYPLLLAVFFMRFAEQESKLFERLAVAAMLLAAPILYAADAAGRFDWASIGLRGIVLLFVGTALVAIFRYALRARDARGYLLLAAGALCVGGAVRDYVLSLVDFDLQPVYLTSYAGLILVLLTAWMLLDRYQRAYSAYRDLNVELEQRVQAANAELRLRLEQAQAAREQAEQANVAKSRFFAAASHDLRQPLHSLGLFTSALDAHLTSPEARETAHNIGQSIAALESLFDALLDLSRLDAGIVVAQPRNVALQAVFDRLARVFHGEAVERELRLRFVPTRAVVRTDPLLLERILSNLVANALRYTREGGVVIGVRRRGARARIEVCDTGIGIAPEKQALVFEEFYQVDNPGRDRRLGLGLGLAIVQRLARLLGHPLALRSASGRGTCFSLDLPRTGEPPDAAPEPQPMVDDEALRGVRLLVVDDDLMVRQGTAALLRQWRAQVRTAASAAEANDALDDGFRPDALIVDLRLGEALDGIGVVEALRQKLGRELPAVLVSGDTGTGELQRVRASGIPMLTKPVAPAKLRSMLRALLQGAAARTA